ncbi:TetR/AcrR family transcriptional regulator [Paenibacillus cellulositrophicus]|uniref:TetR/AcrR family transcriptional regulator n=1 Tax=Paenibacillus cellulositrophicus TaxID=562959 RepID=UPI00203E6457|nr:TetR/AcrR family transcriptional regulator [Paenibacillus cellulositrophicus]MCM2998773.1 TetR/AcrR family transcriptional regulator [Paenibacillus cellulositrophicus]
MSQSSTDLRVVRSRTLMENALLSILENKGIKGLTVKNLCETAGINRGTFYLHYKDIFHLIEETVFIQELLSVFEPLNLQELMRFPDHEGAYPPITKAFQYMHKHASFFKALFHPEAPAELKERLQYLVGTRLYENLKRNQDDHSENLFTDYAIAYLGNAQFGMIQHWFTADRSIPPEDIARMLTRYIRNTPCLDNDG